MKTNSKSKKQSRSLGAAEKLILRLYITGSTPRSIDAVRNLKKFCDDNLDGMCDLEIIDIYQQPERAAEAQIIAAPTLLKSFPLPAQRFVGHLSDTTELSRDLVKKSHSRKKQNPDRGE